MKVCTNPNCKTLNPDEANFCKRCGSPLSGGNSCGDMTFGKAISTCFSKYANFKGRARRAEYWYFYLFYLLIFLPPYVTMLVASSSRHLEELAVTCAVIVLLEWLVFFLPQLAVFVRRMHDIGKSGWNWLIGLIPIVGSIVLLVFLCREGDHKTNEYGNPPK